VLGSISVSYDTVESEGRSRVEVGWVQYTTTGNNTESYSLSIILFYFIFLHRLPSLFFLHSIPGGVASF